MPPCAATGTGAEQPPSEKRPRTDEGGATAAAASSGRAAAEAAAAPGLEGDGVSLGKPSWPTTTAQAAPPAPPEAEGVQGAAGGQGGGGEGPSLAEGAALVKEGVKEIAAAAAAAVASVGKEAAGAAGWALQACPLPLSRCPLHCAPHGSAASHFAAQHGSVPARVSGCYAWSETQKRLDMFACLAQARL